MLSFALRHAEYTVVLVLSLSGWRGVSVVVVLHKERHGRRYTLLGYLCGEIRASEHATE